MGQKYVSCEIRLLKFTVFYMEIWIDGKEIYITIHHVGMY